MKFCCFWKVLDIYEGPEYVPMGEIGRLNLTPEVSVLL